MVALSLAAAYVLGGLCVAFYTHLDNEDLPDLYRSSPLWRGAFWLPLAIAGVAWALVQIIIAGVAELRRR